MQVVKLAALINESLIGHDVPPYHIDVMTDDYSGFGGQLR
jgi:hypothetical protein